MSNKTAIATLGLVLSASLATGSFAAKNQIPNPQDNTEKCYGVSKAGKNDCGTATLQCAGSSTKDGDKESWILLPKGTCDKIVGGSTTSGKS